MPTPSVYLGFTTVHFATGWSLYVFLAFCYFVGIVLALRIVRSPVGAVFSAIRDNPLRAAAVGHNNNPTWTQLPCPGRKCTPERRRAGSMRCSSYS